MLGGVLAEPAIKVVESLAHSGGEALSELSVHFFHESLHEMRPHPHLEAVLRDALRNALAEIGGLEAARQYGDWFANWDRGLDKKARVPFEAPADWVAQTTALATVQNGMDRLFRSTMERVDGQARAARSGSLSLTGGGNFREMPDGLFRLLMERLPAPLNAHLKEQLTLPANDAAWKEATLSWQALMGSNLAEVGATAGRIEQDMRKGFDEIRDLFVANAISAGRINEAEAKAAKAEAGEKEWREKFEAATAAARRDADSGAELLERGDLDGYARLKKEQIQARAGAVKKQARDWADLGRVHDLRFDWAEALKCYREAWRLDPAEPEYGFGVGHFARKQGRFAEAIEAYRGALEAAPDARRRAITLNELGDLYRATQHMPQAETAFREALDVFRNLEQTNPGEYSLHIAMVLGNLGSLYIDLHRPAEAESALEEALAAFRELARDHPEQYLPRVATALNNLGLVRAETRRASDAESAFLEALQIRRGLETAFPAIRPDVAVTLSNLGNLYRGGGRFHEAEEAHKEALAIRRELAQNNPAAFLPVLAHSLNNLANVCQVTGRAEQALALGQEALDIYRDLAQTHPDAYLSRVAMALNNMASAYRDMRQPDELEARAKEAQAILEPLWRGNRALHGNLMANIYLNRAAGAGLRGSPEACGFAREMLACAGAPELKAKARELIERFCSPG